ncbi:MAG TPA: tetratricopeptide repeat-containing glycosyltransferase family protein [Micropepsaceae bacterium]|nr:tetratricopeptide repeat-containing glycosyltransferase family protein [Micropepsaceae bacterium]
MTEPARLIPQDYDSHTVVGATDEALARVEAATQAISDIEGRIRSNKILQRALRAWKRGDTIKTAKFSLEATDADGSNALAFHLLAIALDRMGHLHQALVTYERAYELDPNDSDLLLNLGLTAWNLDLLDGAERMFRLFIERRPDHPAGYNNLGSVQRDKRDLTAAIDTLRGAIYRMPDQAMLWNSLATVLAEEGRGEESLIFYQEAQRLDPKFARVYHNLGYTYTHLGQLDNALEAYDTALKLAPNANERRESLHSRSVCLAGMGRLAEGFKEYEIRHDPEFRARLLHYTKAPLWAGEDLKGKRILIVGEQGVGDELMFANTLPDIARAVGNDGKLQIAVDPRLVTLFQRSFPKAEVGVYDDGKLEGRAVRIFHWAREKGDPDFYAPMGTPLYILRKELADFPRRAFLKADGEKSAAFRVRLEALGPGPYVGICWRSMVMGAKRGKYYSPIDLWGPVLTTPGITFVNLQYGDVASELALAQEKFGVTIHNFSDLNLKDDLDGAAALTAACDLVISAPTAVAGMAGALGRETWFLVSGRVWPQLGTDHYPWYRSTRVFACEKFADWTHLMPQVRTALAKFSTL